MLNAIDVYENGAVEETALPLPRVDPLRKVFIASDGVEIQLTGKRINPLIVQQIQNQGKPDVPQREVTLLGKHKQLMPNPHDPDYVEASEAWKQSASINTGKYLFNVGIKGSPDEEWLAENAEFLPEATASELKYMWIASLVPDVGDIGALIEAIMSFSLATEKGMQDAANFTASE